MQVIASIKLLFIYSLILTYLFCIVLHSGYLNDCKSMCSTYTQRHAPHVGPGAVSKWVSV